MDDGVETKLRVLPIATIVEGRHMSTARAARTLLHSADMELAKNKSSVGFSAYMTAMYQ